MKEKLAIDGGKRVVPEGIVKRWPIITEQDKEAVYEALDNPSGEQITSLEEEWASYVGTKYCLATNSGTAALHMAVAAAGIEPGDEVITSPFTFVASATAILHHNAIPVFADIDPKTFTLDPRKIEPQITEKTKAIMPVHIQGIPANMSEINRISEKHNLVVIEDACQAHGAEYQGKKVGSVGDMGAFSLQGSKALTSGEGGLFVTNDEEFKDKAAMVRSFGEGMGAGGIRKGYNAYAMGWNYRITAFAAAFVRSQLKRLDEYNAARRKNGEYLTQILKEIKGVIPPFVPHNRTHIYWMYPIRFDPAELGLDITPREFRQAMEKALFAEGVLIGQWQTMPVFNQSLFKTKIGYGRGCPWRCPHSRTIEYNEEDYPETLKFIDDYTVVSGIHPPNDLELMEYYGEAFRKVFANLDEAINCSERVKNIPLYTHMYPSLFRRL